MCGSSAAIGSDKFFQQRECNYPTSPWEPCSDAYRIQWPNVRAPVITQSSLASELETSFAMVAASVCLTPLNLMVGVTAMPDESNCDQAHAHQDEGCRLGSDVPR